MAWPLDTTGSQVGPMGAGKLTYLSKTPSGATLKPFSGFEKCCEMVGSTRCAGIQETRSELAMPNSASPTCARTSSQSQRALHSSYRTIEVQASQTYQDLRQSLGLLPQREPDLPAILHLSQPQTIEGAVHLNGCSRRRGASCLYRSKITQCSW